jgi:hypothetical protein
MSTERYRESLYTRVERLTGGRWTLLRLPALLAGLLIVVAAGVAVVMHEIAGLYVALGIVALVGAAVVFVVTWNRRVGREVRTRQSVALRPPTRWRSLNEALAAFEIRTGLESPRIALGERSVFGDSVDAELVFARMDGDGHSVRYVSPMESRPDDRITVVLHEAMLDSFDSEELLAVLVQLVTRASLSQSATRAMDNGVREADSRALLLTHEHRALLSAVEKSAGRRPTPQPDLGIVRFADADLRYRTASSTWNDGHWVEQDRIAELRNHLGPAGLDVPESTTELRA